MILQIARCLVHAAWASMVFTTASLAAPVTGERLSAAAGEPENWLTAAGGQTASRYSGLDFINTENVRELKFLFSVALGPISAGEGFRHTRLSAPLIDDGSAYVVDPFGVVYRIDVSSGTAGRIVWSSPRLEQEMDPWLLGQWTLTLFGEQIILTAGDGRMFWIERADGRVGNTARVGDPATGYVLSAPPVLAGDTLVIGGAGGDRGARPQLTGMDARTGEVLWRSFPAGETGPYVFGGSFLRTGSLDPQSGLVLWSTSGPLPAYTASQRQGEDASNSVLAVDPLTGVLAWRQNLLPEDTLGFNDAGTPLVLPDGGALHVGDDGFVRRFEIASGRLEYASPFVHGLDWYADRAESGAPLAASTATTVPGCPNILAEAHMPATLSARTGLVYAAQNNGCREDLSAVGNLAGEDEGGLYAYMTVSTGAVAAIDPDTGKVTAEHLFDHPLQSGLLSTAGGLLVVPTADGTLHVLDDGTLAPLWSLHISSFMAAPPVTYAVGDRQYIALIVGGGPLYGDLAMRSRDMAGVRHVSVLVVLGVEP